MKPHYRRTAGGSTWPAIRAADGFQNLVANLGTERDKVFSNSYFIQTLSRHELLSAYRGSSVAKSIVDYPAEDCCREWRKWQAKKPQIEALEAEERRLGLQGLVLSARKRARLFGGSAILIGTGDVNPRQPLNPEQIGLGGIKYLTILDRHEVGTSQIQMDPSKPGYGLPEFYQISGATSGMVDIHPSRLVVFIGDEVPDNTTIQSMGGWGDSILQTALEKVSHLDGTLANVASLVFEAKVDVVKIKDFTANLRDGGSEYEKLMLRRFALAMTGKGVNGTLMLDSEEEYDQKRASFSTLPDIMDRFMQVVSAASGIPMTRLFGMSPAGMNSTGEGDMRNYYDRVKQEQTLDMESAMGVLDECLIRSALGNRPDEVHFTWRPLWQTSDKERAENADKLMGALEKLDRMATTPPEAIGKAAVNALTEGGAFPGLEGYVDEFGGVMPPDEDDEDDIGEENNEEVLDDAAPRYRRKTLTDATPRTLYVRRNVLNASDIIAWAKGQGFRTTLPADDMHVTIAFSRAPVDWMKVGEAWETNIEVNAGGPRMMEEFGETGDAKVLLFASSALSWRHEEIKLAGASWDHPEYQPHITISYDPDAPEVGDIKPYRGKIQLGPEIFEELNENWKEGLTER